MRSPIKTKDVQIGGVYAIKLDANDPALDRFKVTEITTTRHGNSPGEVTSYVKGFVITKGEGVVKHEPITLNKKRLLGQYTQHAELVEQERLAQVARDKREAHEAALRTRCYELLASVVGIVIDPDGRKWRTSIDISGSDIPKLVRFLEGGTDKGFEAADAKHAAMMADLEPKDE